jgi:cell division protein FtsA
MEHREQHIVAIDLGTSKIALVVVKVNGDDVQVVYYRETAAAGIINSGVSNMVQACTPLQQLIKDAEESLNIKINQAVIGMPKYPIRQEANSGKVIDRGEFTEITQEDVDNLKRFAQETYPLQSADREAIYGAVAQSFSDGENFQIKEDDIVGMSSDTLEGHFKIFIGRRKELINADSLLAKAGISARKKYFTADTTAHVILSETEMENGVALIDFGGGSTSVAIYHDGIMRHYASIPFGGKNITHDIKSELQITERLAENIKMAFGACMPEKLLSMSEKVLHIIDKNSTQDKQVAVKYLSEIITARVREVMEAVLYEIQESGLAEHLRCGIVITGGVARTANLSMMINEMSGYNVRIGYPKNDIAGYGIDGTHETSATTILGLVAAAMREETATCAIDTGIPKNVEVEVVASEEAKPAAVPAEEPAEDVVEEAEYAEEYETPVQEEAEVEAEVETEVEAEESDQVIVKKDEEKEEEKKDRWKFIKVVWGKAQNIGANINKIIDGITVDEDDESDEE